MHRLARWRGRATRSPPARRDHGSRVTVPGEGNSRSGAGARWSSAPALPARN